MKLLLKSKVYPVQNFEAASLIYSDIRDKSGQGASRFPEGIITDCNGYEIARIGYNGRVWPPQKWYSGMKPLFDPYKD